jgi:hypothetical protein
MTMMLHLLFSIAAIMARLLLATVPYRTHHPLIQTGRLSVQLRHPNSVLQKGKSHKLQQIATRTQTFIPHSGCKSENNAKCQQINDDDNDNHDTASPFHLRGHFDQRPKTNVNAQIAPRHSQLAVRR